MNTTEVPAVRAVCEVTGEPLNAYGRRDNWADRTVDELVPIFENEGGEAAGIRANEIIARDKPLMISAIVMRNRLREVLIERGTMR
jgi:hypothetical protein